MEYQNQIQIQSKLIITNDLRRYVNINPTLEDGVEGTIKYSNAFEPDLICQYIGNSNPNVFLNNGRIIIGHGNHGHKIGKITTDLWWFCAIDDQKLWELAPDYSKIIRKCTVVTVEPGLYRSTCYLDPSEHNPIFAEIVKC